jgi:hypothetical protein
MGTFVLVLALAIATRVGGLFFRMESVESNRWTRRDHPSESPAQRSNTRRPTMGPDTGFYQYSDCKRLHA